MNNLTKKNIIEKSISIEHFEKEMCLSVVYFLISKGVVVYVGQTKNFHSRINSHKTSKTFTDVYFFPIDCNMQKRKIEERYVRRYEPFYNFDLHNKGFTGKSYNELEIKNIDVVFETVNYFKELKYCKQITQSEIFNLKCKRKDLI